VPDPPETEHLILSDSRLTTSFEEETADLSATSPSVDEDEARPRSRSST
jgi:hypothetical protein